MEAGPAGSGASSPDARLALATGKKAGTVVSGSYSLRGDSLELSARLLDTGSGKLLYALDPASGPRNEPGQAVDALKQRVMGAVSYHFASFSGGNFGRPVPYEAYREFVAGSADAGFDWKATLAHTERAVEIDPEFWAAQLRLVAAYSALGTPPRQRRRSLASRTPRPACHPLSSSNSVISRRGGRVAASMPWRPREDTTRWCRGTLSPRIWPRRWPSP